MKQVIVMRTDLNMRKGKMVSQGAHASMKAIFDSSFTIYGTMITGNSNERYLITKIDDIEPWICGIFTKVCVGIGSQAELEALVEKAKSLNLHYSLITDNGLTEFKGIPTVTCAAIGPGPIDVIDSITGHLKLL